MKRTNRLLTGIVTVLVAGSTLAACGSSSSSSTSSGDKSANPTITLYSGQHEQTTAELVKAFEAESGIHVKVRSDDEAVLANQIEQEGSHSPADVFFTENTPPLEFLHEHNLLAPLTASTLAAVDSKYNSTQGDWVGVSARVNVMVYNTDKLHASQLPKSVMDLASPAWKGKLGIAPGETDFQPIVTSIMKEQGESAALAWLEGVKSNAGSHSYPDNESLTDMVNRGQVQIGLINHYYWYRRARRGRRQEHALGDRVLRTARPRLRPRRVRRRGAEVEQATRPRPRSSSRSS